MLHWACLSSSSNQVSSINQSTLFVFVVLVRSSLISHGVKSLCSACLQEIMSYKGRIQLDAMRQSAVFYDSLYPENTCQHAPTSQVVQTNVKTVGLIPWTQEKRQKRHHLSVNVKGYGIPKLWQCEYTTPIAESVAPICCMLSYTPTHTQGFILPLGHKY